MRHLVRLAVPFLLLARVLAAPAWAGGAPPTVIITAQQVALYADRGLLLATGGVSIRIDDVRMSGTQAVYDLRGNALTIAGDVSLAAEGSSTTGPGYVYDFKAGQGHFAAGASVPQISTTQATALAQQAELRPAQSISFTNAQVSSGGVLTPAASFTYAIPAPSSKDFGYSPVPAAALEWPFLVESGHDAYAFARVRYDRYNGGAGTGLEEHFARTDRGYAVLGETLDVNGARYDLSAFTRLNSGLTQSLTGTHLFGVTSLRYALSSSGRRGFASLSFAQYNGTRTDDLYATGNQRPLGRLGQIRAQIDLTHDVHPGDYTGAQDSFVTPALHVDTAAVRLGSSTISGSADAGESLYDFGRARPASDASFWGTFPVDARLQFNAGASFSHDAPPFASTSRTYTGGMNWKSSDAFNLVSSLTYARDYGQIFGVGRPQFSAAFDLRVRRKNGTGVEIGTILPFGGVGNLYRASVFNLRLFR